MLHTQSLSKVTTTETNLRVRNVLLCFLNFLVIIGTAKLRLQQDSAFVSHQFGFIFKLSDTTELVNSYGLVLSAGP